MNLLRGIDFPPALVGAARGVVEAIAFGALTAAAAALTALDVPPEWTWAVMAALVGVRSLEGVADHIDPAKKRAGS